MSNSTALYRRILVATDFSSHAQAALKQAILLASASSPTPEVVVANVVPDIRFVATTPEFGLLYGNFESLQDVYRADAQKQMENLIQTVTKETQSTVPVRFELLIGEAYEEISKLASEGGFDLLMIGMSDIPRGNIFCLAVPPNVSFTIARFRYGQFMTSMSRFRESYWQQRIFPKPAVEPFSLAWKSLS